MVSFTVIEAISQPYQIEIRLANRDQHADPQLLLGRGATLLIERDQQSFGTPRRFGGFIESIRAAGVHGEHGLLDVVLVPAFALLKYTRDSRVFQNLTSREIVMQVLRDALGPFHREIVDNASRTPPRREYCIQHQESIYDFVSRLLEEDGISYIFEQTDDGERLVLIDTMSSYPALSRASGSDTIELVEAHGGTTSQEAISKFVDEHRVFAGTLTAGGFNWTQPARTLRESHHDQAMTVGHNRRKTVENDENRTIGNDRKTRINRHDQTRVRGNRLTVIDGKETVNVHSGRSEDVTGDELLVLRDHRERTVHKNDKLTVRQNKTDHVQQKYEITADERFKVTQGGTYLRFEENKVALHAASEVEIQHGSGIFKIEESGKISIHSAREIELVVGGCNIVMGNGQIRVHAPSGVLVEGGNGRVNLSPTGARVTGPTVDATADAILHLQGALVKLN